MLFTDCMQDFVTHFGQMGSRWGVNRSVGQICALLYISEQPLCADEIGAALGFARSNVSMGLKELEGWGLIQVKHYPKDRKEYFALPNDAWEILRILMAERKKREVDPTLTMLRDVINVDADADQTLHMQKKIREMHELIKTLSKWHGTMERLETQQLMYLLDRGEKVAKLYLKKRKLKVTRTMSVNETVVNDGKY